MNYEKRNRQKLNSKGITLIALVITIIVMLILVGVTVTTALNGGLFGTAKSAVKQTDVEQEREILGSYAISHLVGKYNNEEGSKLGEELLDRDLYNGESWDIVYTDEKEYGTGWNYVEKGTDLGSYGKTKYSWVINYETGEIEYLEEGKFKQLNYKDSVAVTDSLALNIDASNLKSESGWEGIVNHGSDKSGDKGVKYDEASNALIFDGEDDYLELTKPGDFSNGFTFEIYMNLDRLLYEIEKRPGHSCVGLFCKMPSLDSYAPYAMRFGFTDDMSVAKFYDSGNVYNGNNMNTDIEAGVHFLEPEYDKWKNVNKYITIVYYRYNDYKEKSTGNEDIDKSMKEIQNDVLAYYIDGELYGYTGYGIDSYDSGFETWGGDNVPIFIGVCPWGGAGADFLYYLKGKVYALRLYTRPLNSGEVKENYDQTLYSRGELKE